MKKKREKEKKRKRDFNKLKCLKREGKLWFVREKKGVDNSLLLLFNVSLGTV